MLHFAAHLLGNLKCSTFDKFLTGLAGLVYFSYFLYCTDLFVQTVCYFNFRQQHEKFNPATRVYNILEKEENEIRNEESWETQKAQKR